MQIILNKIHKIIKGGINIKEFPPNTNPEFFSTIAAIIGFILEDDFNSYELNSLGNFIILVGQFMLTTAAQQQLINFRHSKITGSKIKSDNNIHHIKNPELAHKHDLDNLYLFLKKLEKEIDDLRKNINS